MKDWNYNNFLLDAKSKEAKYRKKMEYYQEKIKLIDELIKKQEKLNKEK